MRRRSFTAYAVILIACFVTVPGCGNKNDNVQIDSNKSVHPKSPAQVQAIQNNPHIPAHIKAMMLGHNARPPMGGQGQTKP